MLHYFVSWSLTLSIVLVMQWVCHAENSYLLLLETTLMIAEFEGWKTKTTLKTLKGSVELK